MFTRTFTHPFKFMMDGLAGITDLRTGIPLTMTGTPKTASLLGAVAPVVAPTNLLADAVASFEDGSTGGYTVTGITASNYGDAFDGAKCLKLLITNGGAAGHNLAYQSCTAFTSASTQYTLSAYIKAGNAAAVGKQYQVALWDNVGGSTDGAAITLTTSWQRATVTKTFGAGSTTRNIYCARNYNTSQVNDEILIDAVKLETGAAATPFNLGGNYSSCKIATPFAAGDPITIFITFKPTWAGNDNAFHWLFETASGAQRVIVQKTNINDLRVYTKDAAGDTKTKSISALGMVANVEHRVAISLDAANNQRIWLDGVEGLASAGAGVRESAVGANTYFGSDSTGASPADAAILCAIYGEVLDDVPTTGAGIVTFTFDNGLETQYTAGLHVLENQDVKGTFFVLPGYLGTGAYMTAAQVQAIYALGHEIGSHTWSHADLPGLTPTQLTDELSLSKDWIETNCGPCYSFSSPNGLYNDAVIAAIKLYYRSHRTANIGRNSVFGFDEYLLKIHFVQNTTTPADVAVWIAEAVANKEWLILVYHSIDDIEAPNYCPASELEAHIISAKASGLPILTVNDGLDIYDLLVDDSGIGILFSLAAWSELTDITVTGLSASYSAGLYDSSGNLIDSATESGSQAVLDGSTIPVGGFWGTLKVFDGAATIGLRTMHDIWGGDVYKYTLSVDTLVGLKKTALKKPALKIEIWNKADTDRLSILTKDNEDPDLVFQELEFSNNHWGYLSCTFTLKRDSDMYWEDLEDSNIVRVLSGDYVWEGDIEGVVRDKDTETTLKVECLGPQAKLKNMGTDADYDKDLEPGETASTYIVDHILTDPDLLLFAGTIDTNDFEIVTGCLFFPGKAFDQIFSQLMEYNQYRPSVWKDNKLDWKPRETTPTYYVNISDCETSSLNRKRASIKNWVQVAFSPDNSVYGYTVAFDQPSIDRHGKRVSYLSIRGDETDAIQVAAVALAQLKDLKPSSALTTDIIRDAYGGLVPPENVESNKVLHIEKLLSTEETISSAQSINESNTWELAEVKYNKDGRVTLSPGEADDTLDVLLKQLDSRFL